MRPGGRDAGEGVGEIVTAGLANDVEAMNRYPDVM